MVYIILATVEYNAIHLGQHRQIPARHRLLAWIIGLKCVGLFLQAFDAYIFSIWGRGFVVLSFLGEVGRTFYFDFSFLVIKGVCNMSVVSIVNSASQGLVFERESFESLQQDCTLFLGIDIDR